MKASRPIGVLLLSSQGLAPAGIGRTPSGPVFAGGGVVGVELVSVDEGPVLVGVVGDDELDADENWGTMWHAVRMGTSAINGAYRARPRIVTLSEEGEMSPEKVNFIHTGAPVVGRGSSPGIMVPTPLPDRSHRLYRTPANASLLLSALLLSARCDYSGRPAPKFRSRLVWARRRLSCRRRSRAARLGFVGTRARGGGATAARSRSASRARASCRFIS